MTKHYVHLIGPTNVGKHHIGNLLVNEPSLSGSVVVVSMEAIIADRLKNPNFAETFGNHVRTGQLIPDDVAYMLFDEAISEVSHPIIVSDGFLRTPAQVSWAKDQGLLAASSMTFILGAHKRTCRQHALEKVRLRPSGNQLDEDAFEQRFDRHKKSLRRLTTCLSKTGTRIVQIDANRPIDSEVFPIILEHVRAALDKSCESKQVATVSRQPTSLMYRPLSFAQAARI